jgi:hypothetical protein
VTLARRLLLVAGAGGSFAVPAPVEAVLTSVGDGGWPGYSQAFQHNGVVYFGWVDSSGNVEVATYTEDTGVVSSPFVLKAAMEADWHDSPALAMLADGRLIAAYCRHSGSQMYVRISTNPEDITAWGSEVNIDASLGGFQYTYPALFVDAADKVWLFYRDDGLGGSGEPSTYCYSTSTDDGATWAAQTELYTTTDTGNLSYVRVDFDGASRFDFGVTDGTGAADDASVYHFSMTTAGVRKETDGTTIAASLPLVESDLTLVHSGAGAGARYVAGMVGNGGMPVITWPEVTGGASDWYYAAWDGSAWTSHNVVSDGATGDAWVEGGFALDYGDPSIGWLSRNVAGKYEVHRYRTWDAGSTWTVEQISASVSDAFYPIAVRNANRLRSMWVDGTASSEDVFSLRIVGATRY